MTDEVQAPPEEPQAQEASAEADADSGAADTSTPTDTSGETEEVEKPEQKLPFFAGYWHDIPRFQCPKCPFDSLAGPATIQDHIDKTHPNDWLEEA